MLPTSVYDVSKFFISQSNADVSYESDCGLFGCSVRYNSANTNDEQVDINQGQTSSSTHFKLKLKQNSAAATVQNEFSQIPIQIVDRLLQKAEIFASVTEISPKSEVFVGALHVFKRKPTELLSSQTELDLSNFKALLFKDSKGTYADLVILVPRSFSEDDMAKIFQYLQEPEKGMYWKSPQVGYLKKDLVEQLSEGHVSIVPQSSQGAPYFYLDDSKMNFSSRGSSGSVIFTESNRVLGVLQCKENLSSSDLRGNRVESHYRGLSLLYTFQYLEPQIVNSVKELLVVAQKWTAEPNCIPVDKNGGGGI
ncbi:MAG: hypothetical protein ACXVB1_18940 [Pseudobdellovibrionaceae bacterium]